MNADLWQRIRVYLRSSAANILLLWQVLRKTIELKKRAIEHYKNRKVTLQKAAEMMGVSIWEMLDILKKEDLHLDYGLDELQEDLEPITEI